MFYIYQALLLLGSHCLFPKRLRNIPFPKRKEKKFKDQKYTEKWVINNCSQIWPWTLSKCRLGKLPIHVPYRKSCTLSQLIAGFCPGEVGIWEPQKKKKTKFSLKPAVHVAHCLSLHLSDDWDKIPTTTKSKF